MSASNLYTCVSWSMRRMRHPKSLLLLTLTLLIGILYVMSMDNLKSKNKVFEPLVAKETECDVLTMEKWLEVEHKHEHSAPNDRNVMKTASKILIVSSQRIKEASELSQEVAKILVAHRFRYKVVQMEDDDRLNDLLTYHDTDSEEGKFAIIVVAHLQAFLNMEISKKHIVAQYCSKFNVKVVAFAPGPILSSDIGIKSSMVDNIVQLSTVNDSEVFRIIRGGQSMRGQNVKESVVFDQSESYKSLVLAEDDYGSSHSAVVQSIDESEDERPSLIIGLPLSHVLSHLLLLDAVSFYTQGLLQTTLKRRIMIDVDDIFVGKVRLSPDDVLHMIQSQHRLQQSIRNFRYNLGFSGGYFHRSNKSSDRAGEDLLLRNHRSFTWFPHSYQHYQAHQASLNSSKLVRQMELNRKFAKDHNLDVSQKYAVAPHHSGVYPVHEDLYTAWKSVWDIEVTSTEEYPHLRPDRLRRGFQFRDIRVLPRQTCGLFTKNVYYRDYPNGPQVLERSIEGGELFTTIVDNEVLIFMTHMPNYAGDRLAPYVFESVVHYIRCWTNFLMVSESPSQMATFYFQRHPQELMPIWGNPCLDTRHLEIWSPQKSCRRLPDILVVGPQKSGSTALARFMAIHPRLIQNRPSEKTFEEVQFFGDNNNYVKGIDWYMSFFPFRNSSSPSSLSSSLYFDKSANYFDHRLAPMRAHQLLPNVFIIVILIAPWDRAYSWYQHMRAHNDVTAIKYTFDEVIIAHEATDGKMDEGLKRLRTRCLEPGKYSVHLDRWLNYYSADRLYIVDGEELRSSPDIVLNTLQRFIEVNIDINFSERIKYNEKKGFFCEVSSSGKFRCLGKGKGRHYPPMSSAVLDHLQSYYRSFNEQLMEVFERRLHRRPPKWLRKEMERSSKESFYV